MAKPADDEPLARLALCLGAARDLPAVHASLRRYLAETTPLNGLFMSRYDESTGLRTCVYAYSDGHDVDVSGLPPLPLTGSPHSRAVATGDVIIADDFEGAMAGSPRVDLGTDVDPRLPRSCIAVPMVARGRVVGAFEIQSLQLAAFHTGHAAHLRLAANLAALAVENVDLLASERSARERAEQHADEIAHFNEILEDRVIERTRELAGLNRDLQTFSYTVAHDLKSPLRAIDFLARSTLEDHPGGLGPEVTSNLGRIGAGARRMGQLVEGLMVLCQAGMGELAEEDVDLTVMAEDVAADLQIAYGERVATFEVERGLVARGDKRLLRVVVDNLVGNAWKFSARKPQTRIEVGQAVTPEGSAFYVRDFGVGFDAHQARRIFQVFQRLHDPSQYEGTGIGLTTVERIVRRHGGKVWAEGTPGVGATFYFTLPGVAPHSRRVPMERAVRKER